MKNTVLAFGILFCSLSAMAAIMPMNPVQGKFTFRGEVQMTNKVRSIYFGAQTENLNELVKKYQSAGFTCELLDNDDYSCGKSEAVTEADSVWIAKAKTDLQDHWLKFAAPTEPPVLEHANGSSTIWAVTQDVTLPNENVIPEMEYSFSGKDWKNISFFDQIGMEQYDFHIASATRLTKDMTYSVDEADKTHLEVTVTCAFDSAAE